MNKTVIVDFKWTPENTGGKKHIFPKGMRFRPIMVIVGNENADSLWSANVLNLSVQGRETKSEVSYIADDAPHHMLLSGNSVLLYEGHNVIAEGTISG